MAKKKFTPSTLDDRHNYLREIIIHVVEAHGAPCGCVLCEALIFDSLAAEGTLNLRTGERK